MLSSLQGRGKHIPKIGGGGFVTDMLTQVPTDQISTWGGGSLYKASSADTRA